MWQFALKFHKGNDLFQKAKGKLGILLNTHTGMHTNTCTQARKKENIYIKLHTENKS